MLFFIFLMNIGKPTKKTQHAVSVARRAGRCVLSLEHDCDCSTETVTAASTRITHSALCTYDMCAHDHSLPLWIVLSGASPQNKASVGVRTRLCGQLCGRDLDRSKQKVSSLKKGPPVKAKQDTFSFHSAYMCEAIQSSCCRAGRDAQKREPSLIPHRP